MNFEIKTHYFDDTTSLLKAAQKHTINRESNWWGAYASVYDLGDRVMKVSNGDDLGYLSYLETMSELKINNRHLPVIYEVDYYRLTDEARKECRMYRHTEKIVTYMEKLKQPPKKARRTYDKSGDLIKCSWPAVHNWTAALGRYVDWLKKPYSHLSLEHQELIVLLRIAEEHYATKYPQDYGRFDLHSGNAMLRGKTIVVTDPLA